MLWLGYVRNSIQFLVTGMIIGFGFGILIPTCQAAINQLIKSNERGAANSTYLISYDLGIGVGSRIIGFLSDKVSLGEIYRYTIFLIILAAGIFVIKAIPHYHVTDRMADLSLDSSYNSVSDTSDPDSKNAIQRGSCLGADQNFEACADRRRILLCFHL